MKFRMKSDTVLGLLLGGAIIITSPLRLMADDIDEQYSHASDLLWKGELRAAQTELRAILQLRPSYGRAKVLLGLTLAKLAEQTEREGDPAGAVAQLREGLLLDPEEAYWHRALAHLLHAQGNTEEATRECSQAAKLSPDDTDLARGCGFGPSPEIRKDNSVPYWKDLAGNRDSTPPVPETHPNPDYSEKARVARLQGRLVLWVVVDVHGDVEEAAMDESLGLGLDECALRTVRTWKFKPATLNGTPIRARVMVEISFRLF